MKRSEEFRILRAKLSLTGEALAAKLRVDVRTIRKWEGGERNPPWATLELLRKWTKSA